MAGWTALEPDRVPTIADLRVYNSLGRALRERGVEQPDAITASEQAWAERISRIGFDHAGDFDTLIFEGAPLGPFDEDALLGHVANLVVEIADLESSQGYALAWEAYRGSPKCDDEEVVQSILDAAREHPKSWILPG